MKRNIHLKEAKVYQNIGGNWFMSLTYSYDDTDGRHELIYPKVEFPFTTKEFPHTYTEDDCCWENRMLMTTVHDHIVYKGVPIDPRTAKTLDACYMADILVEPKVCEMTLEEIEKKLGYKVKIISDKGEKS